MRIAKAIRPVVSGAGATQTLTARDSGSIVLFDRAAGITYTLPPPQVGLWYEFHVTVTGTGTYRVETSASTIFMSGNVNIEVDDNTTGKAFPGNGTSHLACRAAAALSGWLIGGSFSVTCVSSTLWVVKGILQGSGTLATPFVTS